MPDNNQDPVQNQNLDLLSIGEASEYLGISIDTLRRWEKKGRINPMRSPGGHRYFNKKDLEDLFGKRYTRYESAATEIPNSTQNIESQESDSQEAQILQPSIPPETITTNITHPPIQEDIPTSPPAIPTPSAVNTSTVGLPAWRTVAKEEVEEIQVEKKDNKLEITDTKTVSEVSIGSQATPPPSPAKTTTSSLPQVLSRPAREVKIPEVAKVKVLTERQEMIMSSQEDKLTSAAETYIREESESILTPKIEKKEKESLQSSQEEDIQKVSKDIARAQNTSITKKETTTSTSAFTKLKDNKYRKQIGAVLVFIGLTLGSVAWYYAWKASQIVLSPVP